MNPKNFIIPSLVIVIAVLSGILVLQTQTPQPDVSTKQPPTEQPPTEQPPTEQPPTEQPPSEQSPSEQSPSEQQPSEQQPTVTITSPKEGARVPHPVPLEGTVENLKNEELWLVVKIGNTYYPQTGQLFIEDNKWSGTAYVGNSQLGADKGRQFTILVVVASSETGQRYTDYLDTATRNNSYPGISSLLGGKSINRITVIRDDSAAD